MANFKININGDTNKIPKQEEVKEEEVVEEHPEIPDLPVAPVIEKPEPKQTPEPEEHEEEKSPKRKKKGLKRKSVKSNIPDKPLDVESAYKAYRARKLTVFIVLILFVVSIVGFGAYNTFFKHQMTPDEATMYVNSANNQSLAQGWDSGVQSFLQKNLATIMKNSFQSNANAKEFTVDNISVEKNQPLGDTTFLTFFSCDVIANGKTDRVFCNIMIDTNGGKYKAISGVNISTREPYSSDSEVAEKNKYLDFDETEVNQEESKKFKVVLDNFLTLGYNSKQDITNIYKGKTPLKFEGTYKQIDSCTVYNKQNELGYNAKATYTIELPTGVTYQNTVYMKIEKNSSGSYVINMIL